MTILFVAGIFLATGLLLLAISVALGWTPNTAESGKYWYPAGPDPEPWRTG